MKIYRWKVVRSFCSVLTKREYHLTNSGVYHCWRGQRYGFIVPKVFKAEDAVKFVLNSIS